eukprot:1004953-Pleurochrysis_carterae.AAC.1
MDCKKTERSSRLCSSNRSSPDDTTHANRCTTFQRSRSPRQCRCTVVAREGDCGAGDVFVHMGVGGGPSSSIESSISVGARLAERVRDGRTSASTRRENQETFNRLTPTLRTRPCAPRAAIGRAQTSTVCVAELNLLEAHDEGQDRRQLSCARKQSARVARATIGAHK